MLESMFALPAAGTAKLVFFPGLGLEFHLQRVAIILFGRPIYWYGVIITCGMLLAYFLCSRWCSRFGIKQNDLLDFLLIGLPVALLSIRAYYVIFNLELYRRADGSLDWAAIIRFSDGGLAVYGGIISSVIVLLIFCRVKKISFAAFADLGAHGLILGQLIGRWGNFMNVEAYGGLTQLPWRMCSPSIADELAWRDILDGPGQHQAILDGTLGVHPTFLYESLWNLVGFLLIYWMGKHFYKFNGQCFLFYVIWYGLGRTWIEGLRTDSLYLYVGSSIRVSQLVAAGSALIAAGIFLWLWTRNKRSYPEKAKIADVDSAANEDNTKEK